MTQLKITDIEVPDEQKIKRIVAVFAPNGDRFDRLHAVEHACEELDYKLTDDTINSIAEEPGTGTGDIKTGHGGIAITPDGGMGKMLETVKKYPVDDVVVSDLRSISPVRDLAEFVRAVTAEGVCVHSVYDKITIESGSSEHRLLEIAADIERENARPEFVAEGTEHHGRAPLGYTVKNGGLVKDDNYDEVMFTLTDVVSGRLSQSKAANRLDTSRATIKRCIDERPEMYRLDE